jgi:hypothetical protein
MIRHHHEFIIPQLHVWPDLGGFEPFVAHDVAPRIQLHVAVHHLAEHMRAAVGDDGDEICAWLGVIVPRQPDGSAVVASRIVGWHATSSVG